MPTRLPSLLDRVLLFAHRGARANEKENSRAAFELALRLGATALQADVWLTADGQPVLDRTGTVRRFPRKPIGAVARADVDGRLDLADLVDVAATAGVDIRLALGDESNAAVDAVLDAARPHGWASRIWLAHRDLEVLSEWRDRGPALRLINATTKDDMPFGAERRAAELAAARVDALALPESEWTGGLVTLVHRFDICAFADGAHYERQLARVIDMGVDAVSGDHVERMAAVAATFEDSDV
ncbi:MAG: glycerophosphodiester phosphodiesterase family protein [Actinomycetota bacterium]